MLIDNPFFFDVSGKSVGRRIAADSEPSHKHTTVVDTGRQVMVMTSLLKWY